MRVELPVDRGYLLQVSSLFGAVYDAKHLASLDWHARCGRDRHTHATDASEIQKVLRALFLGTYKSPHILRVRTATDYRPGFAGYLDLDLAGVRHHGLAAIAIAVVAGLVIDDQPVDRKEMQGIANVLLAGGRDTVIKLLSGFVWHLIEKPSDADFIRESEEHFRPAIQEMARYLSPLPRMERVPREYAVGEDASRDTEKYVLLGFVSANHDPERFENPAEINFERERNAHIAFGFGPHSCLGQNITEIETVAFLKGILPELASWKFAEEPNLVWVDEPLADGSTTRYLDKFKEIRITSAQPE